MIKKKDRQKLHQSSVTDLEKQLTDLQAELPKVRNQLKLGKLTNLKVAKKIRYQIALIKTIIGNKALTKQVEK